MDFIEQWFGISPDGGNGSLEALWIGAIVVVVALAAPAQALASGGAGGAQAALQAATTAQGALGAAVSGQTAVNARDRIGAGAAQPAAYFDARSVDPRQRPHRRYSRPGILDSR